MPMGRTVRRMTLGLLVAGGAVSAGAYYLLRRPVPRGRGRLKLRGLRAGAEILREGVVNMAEVAEALGRPVRARA